MTQSGPKWVRGVSVARDGLAGLAACEHHFGCPPSGFLGEFRSYYGPTMNAFAAAEGSDRADKLQAELEALFDSQNTSASLAVTRIPANFLRVTVVRE